VKWGGFDLDDLAFPRRRCRRRRIRIVFAFGPFTKQSARVSGGSYARPPAATAPRTLADVYLDTLVSDLLKRSLVVAFELPADEQTVCHPQFLDKWGNPARVDGVSEWLTDNPNLLNLTPSTDGLSCTIVAVGPLGSATVVCKADADLGAGVKTIFASGAVTVTPGEATQVTLNFDPPTPQP